MQDHHEQYSMVVIFGKPGAGKTTIAEAAFQQLQMHVNTTPTTTPTSTTNNNNTTNKNNNNNINNQCLLLDLDVCVPTWMKDNFANGIYPSLDQRKEFAFSACDYVDAEIKASNSHSNSHSNNDNDNQTETMSSSSSSISASTSLFIIISFSFVNTDLRDHFRSRFPHVNWALVDVTDSTAQQRIDAREGHFYKGKNNNNDGNGNGAAQHEIDDEKDISNTTHEKDDKEENDKDDANDKDNSEWDFAPVDFEHVLLDGLLSIEQNANHVVDLLSLHHRTY